MRGDGVAQSHVLPAYGDLRHADALPLRNESDGLVTGEIAWILGRRFTTGQAPPNARGIGNDGLADGPDGAPRANARPADFSRQSAHSLGGGFGPDRMQRLASTAWVENFFVNTFFRESVDLMGLSLVGPTVLFMAPHLKQYAPFLAGATALHSVDLPHVLCTRYRAAPHQLSSQLKKITLDGTVAAGAPALVAPYNGAQAAQYVRPLASRGPAPYLTSAADPAVTLPVAGVRGAAAATEGFQTGLSLMSRGPFLRGHMQATNEVLCLDPTGFVATGAPPDVTRDSQPFAMLPRNFGDRAAFAALYAELKARSLFDWTPDGLVLSKLESPSGDTVGSSTLDARQGQLFNICVQGPALAKAWLGNPLLHCMPMDKVFVVLCADAIHVTGADAAGGGANTAGPRDAFDAVRESPPAQYEANKAVLDVAIETAVNGVGASAANGAIAAFEAAADGYVRSTKELVTATTGTREIESTIGAFEGAMASYMEWPTGPAEAAFAASWERRAQTERTGATKPAAAKLTNFRLRRVTSSYLANYSAHKPGDPTSRCGMRIGAGTAPAGALADALAADVADQPALLKSSATPAGVDAANVCIGAQYIVGGWCIGTVVDNAASRASVNQAVRTAPASMLLNVNVKVDWWSGDDLHRAYMDEGVLGRGSKVPDAGGGELLRDLGLDRSATSLPEYNAMGPAPPPPP